MGELLMRNILTRKEIKMNKIKINKQTVFLFTSVFVIVFSGAVLGFSVYNNFSNDILVATADDLVLDDQEATIRAIKKVIPAVVSIIVYDYDYVERFDVVSGEIEFEKKRQQKIKGTGFLVSADGYIFTNKHVVDAVKEDSGEYKIILNTGKEYFAQLIDKDNAKDLAVLKIFDKDLPYVELGDSDKLELGTSVIAIGNALGRYSNSVTKGIVSGLERSLTAANPNGGMEELTNVIQTDANINVGNSGGPLINLYGEVIGINVATEASGASIGFAIPVNDAKPAIRSILSSGLIVKPMLGVRYIMLTPDLARENNLGRDNGAWISGGEKEVAVLENSAAFESGLRENDVIFEINAIKINHENTLSKIIGNFRPGDRIGLKVQRAGHVFIAEVKLTKLK